MSKLFTWLHSLLTDEENQWDIGLLFWFAGFGVFLWKAIVAPAPFDFVSFGAGLTGVCAAGAGLRWIKVKEIKNHADIVEANKPGDE